MSAVATAIPTGTYRTDGVHSSVGFAVKHMAVATFRGSFEEYDATLTVADGEARLVGSAPVRSLTAKDEHLREHLLSAEFFDADNHPEVRFESTSFAIEGEEAVVEGDLTIKGITRHVRAQGPITEATEDAFGSTRLGVILKTVVDRTTFDLNWNMPLPKGGVALANDVTLTVELELVRE